MVPFYASPGDISDGKIVLRKDQAIHATRVRRHKVGDIVDVLDGVGNTYRVRLDAVGAEALEGTILEDEPEARPAIEITLAQALLKGSRFDLVVEKCAELGVRRIVPLTTARTVASKVSSNRLERWRRIAIEATKQSLGSYVPRVGKPQPLAQLLPKLAAEGRMLVAWEEEKRAFLRDILVNGDKAKKISLVVGPEGGFTDEEIRQARSLGAGCFSLGPQRLRAETASIVAVAMVQYELALRDRGEAEQNVWLRKRYH